MQHGKSLKHTFNEVAQLYADARPVYPDKLFETLIKLAALHKDSKLLEIGPGTGQATIPLAKNGLNITAIELGDALGELARNKLGAYKNVSILTGAFEEVFLPSEYFDLVFAATSFHWIDPSLKFKKCHDVLNRKGHLAIIHTNHVSDGKGDDFFYASLPIYERYDFIDKHRAPRLPPVEELRPDDLDEQFFRLKHFELFPVVVTYSSRAYARLLNTFSNHLAAPHVVQRAFYKEIEHFIEKDFDGEIEKHFVMSLTIAQKV